MIKNKKYSNSEIHDFKISNPDIKLKVVPSGLGIAGAITSISCIAFFNLAIIITLFLTVGSIAVYVIGSIWFIISIIAIVESALFLGRFQNKTRAGIIGIIAGLIGLVGMIGGIMILSSKSKVKDIIITNEEKVNEIIIT